MVIFSKRVAIDPSALHTHIRYEFDSPADGEKMVVRYSYSPKKYTGGDAAALARSAFEKAYPEDVPVRDADVSSALPLNNHITLSLEKEGILIGTAHRHSPENVFEISSDSASPGFFPTAVEKGRYAVSLAVHAILSDAVTANVEVEII